MPTKQEKDIKNLECLLSWDFNYAFNFLLCYVEKNIPATTDISRRKKRRLQGL
jgi:hypothetical protein